MFARVTEHRLVAIVGAFRSGQCRHIGLAQVCGRLDQRVEDALEIEGRAADDLEHVGGGSLLLQRFAQLVEQTGVLDGDDGLAGEILDQLDLLLGERPDLLAVDGDSADQRIVLRASVR